MSEIDDSRAPLLDHLIELRRRLLYCIAALVLCFAVAMYFVEPVFAFLLAPLRAAGQKEVIFTTVYGGFFTEVKLAFFASMMLSFPVIANQLWRFVAPGLYKKEKRAVLPFLAATPVLFLGGAALAYFVAVPIALHFFLGYSGNIGGVRRQALPDVAEYLSFIMHLLFGFGLAFLLPILLMLLERAGIVTRKQLVGARRYAIVAAFAVSAVLTPPDVGSQLLLAIPLVLLYEAALVGIWITERRRAREPVAAVAAIDD
ncbi:twin-arginine translocase subunit TatC [uncultured Sphingomonas sp.]|uniref:twin-arginine translocase subunit TatC n=1 Tax=uncultured Sphingomonas sp. TaxID=158754 RepID=UPI0035CB5C99